MPERYFPVKRGCLVVIVAVPLLVLGAAAYGYYALKQAYGLSPASPISSETLVTPETRTRIVVSREKLVPFLKGFVPGGALPLPWYASFLVKDPIEEFLPYEVALLGGADYKDNQYRVTAFVNERVMGPLVTTMARGFFAAQEERMRAAGNTPEAQIFRSIKWQDGFVDNSERGKLTMSAGLPLPAGMESRVLKSWKMNKAASTEVPEGGHLLEGVLDNTGGELMTLIGTVGKLQGMSLDQVFDPNAPQVMQIVKAIDAIRLTGDLTGDDELTLTLSFNLNTDDYMTRAPFLVLSQTLIDGSAALEMIMSGGQRNVTADTAQFKGLKRLAQPYGITVDYLNGDKPVFDGNTLIASYVVSGFRPLIQTKVDEAVKQLAALQ